MTLVRNRPGVGCGPLRNRRRLKIKVTWSGRPMSRLSWITCSKKIRPDRGRSSIWVRENSACRTEMSYRYPAARSASAHGLGKIASHLSSSACICSGPSRSQICCSAAGSSTVANALSSGVNPIPALAAWHWAQWLPLKQAQLGVVGEVGAELDEERPEVLVHAVEVEVVDHPGRLHDPRVGPQNS